MKHFADGRAHAELASGSGRNGLASILALGDMREWRLCGGFLPSDTGIAFADFDELDAALLELVAPTLVVSPLLARGFDCTDVALRLYDLGYAGAYRALARPLPNPMLVVAEVRMLCPGLDFDIAELPER